MKDRSMYVSKKESKEVINKEKEREKCRKKEGKQVKQERHRSKQEMT